jgi:hypothetical protein
MLVFGVGVVIGVKEMFALLVDVLFCLRMLGDFYEFFDSGCLWVETLLDHKDLLFFRSLSGQNVHDVSVRELLNFR